MFLSDIACAKDPCLKYANQDSCLFAMVGTIRMTLASREPAHTPSYAQRKQSAPFPESQSVELFHWSDEIHAEKETDLVSDVTAVFSLSSLDVQKTMGSTWLGLRFDPF